jgi:hypothetical protein
MEQFGIFDGHMTRFAKLLRSPDRQFVNTFTLIFVDEVQTTYTAGMAKHGQPAFRPSYGRFDTYRTLFRKSTAVIGFSATLPPHILKCVKQKLSLRPGFFHINRLGGPDESVRIG